MNNSWCCQRTFQYIIESFFPHTRLGCAAYHHNPPGDPMGPVNKDFVAYAFLASMRHVSSWRAPSQRQPGSKFRVLRDAVLNNPFVGPCQREVLLARFSKAQSRGSARTCRRAGGLESICDLLRRALNRFWSRCRCREALGV